MTVAPRRWQFRLGAGRWGIVAAVLVALAILTEASLAETTRRPILGVRAIGVGDNLVIAWVQPAGWAWDAGVRPGDTLVAIDDHVIVPGADPGSVAAASSIQVRSADGTVAAASVTVVGGLATVRYRPSFLAIAACFAAVGGLVFLLAADLLAAGVFLGFAVAWATTLIAAVAIPFGSTWAIGVEFAAVVGFGTATLLLFLAFPVDRLRTRAGRFVASGAVAVGVAFIATYWGIVATNTAAYAALQPAVLAALALELLGASALVALPFVRPPADRRDSRPVLGVVALGALVGLLPFCLLALLPRLLGSGYVVPPDVAILSVGALPVSLGAAILSRQFLGIRHFLRRGLIALVVWIGLVGAYGLLFHLAQRLLAGSGATIAGVLGSPLLGIAVIAATFPFLQLWLRRCLAARLFHDVYDYAATLERLGAEIVRLASVDRIAGHVLARLGETLDLRWAALALDGEGPPAPLYRWGECNIDLSARALLACCSPRSGDADGHPSSSAARAEPLMVDGVAFGVLVVGPKRHDIDLSPEDRGLIATLVPLVSSALQNALLVRRLESKVAILGERETELAALSARLLEVQEAERRRIALDLHDDPLQRSLQLARNVGGRTGCPHARAWHQDLEEISNSLRAICMDLRPPVLDDLGLVAGLEQLVETVQVRADIATCLAVEVPGERAPERLPRGLEVALYRVTQEALNNCVKHARADHIRVSLRHEPRRVALRVSDDGRGVTAARAGEDAGRALPLGILGMRERLRPWGGTLRVEAGVDGGTIVTAEIPLRGGDGRAT